MKPLHRFLALFAFLAALGAIPAADWPNWRGPHHDGISREKGLFTSWPQDGPRVLWKVDLPGGYSSVAVADGRLFTQSKEKAEATAKEYVQKAKWQALQGRCWSAPVLANGVLYVRHETKMLALEVGKR